MTIFFDVTGRPVSKERLEKLRDENRVNDVWYWFVTLVFTISAIASAVGVAVVGLTWLFTRGPDALAWGLWVLALVVMALAWFENRRLEKKAANRQELKDINPDQLAELAEVFKKYDYPKLKAERDAVVAQRRGFCVGEYRGILRYVEEESQRQAILSDKKSVYG